MSNRYRDKHGVRRNLRTGRRIISTREREKRERLQTLMEQHQQRVEDMKAERASSSKKR